MGVNRVIRVGVFVTHPVQYHVPIWAALSKVPDISLKVYYFSDHSVRGGVDPGFGVPVAWDTPLTAGYESEFISRDADLARPSSVSIKDPRELLQRGAFDWVLIHGYTYRFERQLVRASADLGVKVLIRGEFTDHGHRKWITRILRGLYLRWFYSMVTSFCYIGSNSRDHLLSRGIPKHRLFFSPYSVDTSLFELQRSRFQREVARTSLGLPGNLFVLLFSGKLISRKQPQLILQALSLICEQDRQKIALVILGDGPLRQIVEAQGKELLGQRFLIAGFVNQAEIGKYMVAADALILPSNYETWGLVVNEAMQFELPVIVSDAVGCGPDLVVDGGTGFTFPNGNAEAMAKHIRYLLSNSEGAKEMGRNARRQVSAFSTTQSTHGILDALRAS